MKTKIFLAHSAGLQSAPGEGSFDLAQYLRNVAGANSELIFPVVKDPDNPSYKNWKTLLDTEIEKLQEPVILIGHSLGASVLLKYLSEEQPDLQIKGLFLVAAPQWSSDGWDTKEFALQQNDPAKLIQVDQLYFYHCIGDPIVPFEHLNYYRDAFPDAVSEN